MVSLLFDSIMKDIKSLKITRKKRIVLSKHGRFRCDKKIKI